MKNIRDIYNIPLDDSNTWELICDGKCAGLFQVESGLCTTWCQRIKPHNIEELSAVISLVRPGCLRAMEAGKSLTQHFCDRKNGIDEIMSIHPVVDTILKPTQSVLVYQESSMKLAMECAGFNQQEAEELRKAAGKKLADLMSQVKIKFIEKAKTFGVITEELAIKLFSWIEKSNRYSFCKAHGIAYALNAYFTAYLKYYYPKEFFNSWLHYGLTSQDPFEEIMKIANDARLFGIDVSVPDIRLGNKNFIIQGNRIVCGLVAIKGVGTAQIIKLREALKELPPDPSWQDILILMSDKVSSTCITNVIKVGGLDFCKDSRKSMLRDYDLWNELTEKEKNCVQLQYQETKLPLIEILKVSAKPKKEGGICSNKNRVAIVQSLVQSLETSSYSLVDDPAWIANQEKTLLGLALTCSQVDACETYQANCTCKEFINKEIELREGYVLAAHINEIRSLKIKNGKNIGRRMAYLTIGDASGIINNVVVFSDEFEKFSSLLSEGNNVLIQGIRDKKQNTLIVKEVQQL